MCCINPPGVARRVQGSRCSGQCTGAVQCARWTPRLTVLAVACACRKTFAGRCACLFAGGLSVLRVLIVFVNVYGVE